MQSDKVLCTCFKCKNETDNIGKYVHPTTKWRHRRKYNFSLNELSDEEEVKYNFNLNELSDDEEEVKFNRLVILKKLIYLIMTIIKLFLFYF
jgi:hypothetical protein